MTISTTLIPALLGMSTGLALIVAIGAQNAYLLRLGIQARNRTLLPVVLFCAGSDAVLILAGVAGVGAVIQHAPVALVIVRVIGAAFLIVYGCFAARRVFRPAALVVDGAEGSADPVARATPGEGAPAPRGATALLTRRGAAARVTAPIGVRTALAAIIPLTWLNPHVYLDTVVFLGSVANQQGLAERWWWAAGAVVGSFIWFFAIGFGARLLRPFFARPVSWRILDGVIAVIMLGLGVRMAIGI